MSYFYGLQYDLVDWLRLLREGSTRQEEGHGGVFRPEDLEEEDGQEEGSDHAFGDRTECPD